MRITNNVLQREALANYQRGLAEMSEIRERIATGTRIRQASDDPVAAGAILRTDGRLRALEQYRRNIGAARVRVTAEENVLEQLTGLLTRAKELAVGQADAAADAETRAAARQEVDSLLATVIQLGNTRFQGSYLFGGAFADTPPFDAAGAIDPSRPPVGDYRVEVAAGQLVRAHHDGQTVFVDSGIIAALEDLSTALGANDTAGIQAAISAVDGAFDGIQSLTGEVGARAAGLDVAGANVEAWDVNLRTFRSDLADVEVEEAITRLVGRQVAFQAALLANSRILQTTLTDYLR